MATHRAGVQRWRDFLLFLEITYAHNHRCSHPDGVHA